MGEQCHKSLTRILTTSGNSQFNKSPTILFSLDLHHIEATYSNKGSKQPRAYTWGLQRLGDQAAGSDQATLFQEEAGEEVRTRAEQSRAQLSRAAPGEAAYAGDVSAWKHKKQGLQVSERGSYPQGGWEAGVMPCSPQAQGSRGGGGGGGQHPCKASLQLVVSIHAFCFHTLRSVWHTLLHSHTLVLASVSSLMTLSFSLVRYLHSISSLLCNSFLALYH